MSSEPRNEFPVWREGNVVTVREIKSPNNVSHFLKALLDARQRGYQEVILDFEKVAKVFPNACVPISAIIQYYKKNGFNILIQNQPEILKYTYFEQPLSSTSELLRKELSPLSKVWQYKNEHEVFELVTALVEAIAEGVECNTGVLEAIEWCLNEVMDNVLQHSTTSSGFIMIQLHREKKRLAVCIADTGIGIYGSLRESVHKPKTVVDAITMAVKEGVTRDPKVGQGNGLWGLLRIQVIS